MYNNLEPTIRQEIRQGAGWGIAVGVLLIILGIVAIALPFATAIALSLLFGWLFILGAIAQIIYAFASRRARSFIWNIVAGCVLPDWRHICAALPWYHRPDPQFNSGH